MRRTLVALSLAVMTALPFASVAGAQGITITPAAGGVLDEYALEGSGLPPGLALDIGFLAPEGTIYNLASTGTVWIVDPDGTFEFTFVPANEFPNSLTGEWLVEICASGTQDCVRGTFMIQ